MGNKVLIADDKPELVSLVGEQFRAVFPDFETERFSNGVDLLSRLDSRTSDVALVFTDNDMPGGVRGIDIVRKYAKQIPMILYSGVYNIAEEVVSYGATFLGKPYSLSQFEQTVNEALTAIGTTSR